MLNRVTPAPSHFRHRDPSCLTDRRQSKIAPEINLSTKAGTNRRRIADRIVFAFRSRPHLVAKLGPCAICVSPIGVPVPPCPSALIFRKPDSYPVKPGWSPAARRSNTERIADESATSGPSRFVHRNMLYLNAFLTIRAGFR